MKAIISHETALHYWRKHFPLDGELGKPARISASEAIAHNKADVLECLSSYVGSADTPIDFLVFNEAANRKSKRATCHVWASPIPENAFYRVGNMLVSSPEFVFLQLAKSLNIQELIALGCELCGNYALVDHAPDDPFPSRVYPLTNKLKLTRFLDAAKGAQGIKAARRALKYVVESARSPMETCAYMQLSLPPLLGGYGLPAPQMNAYIKLDDEAQLIARRHWCYGDLCWTEQKLDIEYNGEYHSSAAQMRDDAGRLLGIEHMGWKVMTITESQIANIDKFEIVAREVAKHLKARIRPKALGHTPARMLLHGILHSNG